MAIYILLADGFEEIEALAPADILRRAGADLKLVSVMETEMVTGSNGIKVAADIMIDEVVREAAECIVLPGGTRGASFLGESLKVKSLVEHAVSQGIYVAAICAAPAILADMGLLDGRRAVCYPSLLDKLSQSVITGKRIEHDDIFITAQAMGSSIEFGLKLVEVMYGSDKSDEIRKAICAE